MKALRSTLTALGGLAVGSAGLIGLTSPAEAARAELPFVDVQTIEDGRGDLRVLVDPGDLSAFRNELILSAFLEFDLPGNTPLEDLDVAAHALTTEWAGTRATWTSPWTTPGGDMEEDYYDSLVLRKDRAAAALRLDVTDSIRSMVEGTLAANGFILIPAEETRTGFSAGDAAVLGELDGKLVVSYRVVTAHGMIGSDRR